MTLLEMSVRYQDSAAAIRQRISELRLAVRLAEDPDTAHALQRRITELTPCCRRPGSWRSSPPITMTGAITNMRDTRFDSRSSEWIGDMAVWRRENADDNSEQLSRLRRNLHRARERELTARQREMVALYYDRGLKMSQIARRLGVTQSTVSRTLKRARDRLRRYLRYSL